MEDSPGTPSDEPRASSTPHAPAEWVDKADTLDMRPGLQAVFLRRWWVIVATVVAAAASALIINARPDRYEAAVIVLIGSRPTPNADADAPSLPSEPYLNAVAMMSHAKVRARLPQGSGDGERVRAVRTTRAPDQDVPMPRVFGIRLVVEADTPEVASQYANTWAQVYIEEHVSITPVEKHARDISKVALELAISELAVASENVAAAQQNLMALEERQSKEMSTLKYSMTLFSRSDLINPLKADLRATHLRMREVRETMDQLGEELKQTPATLSRGVPGAGAADRNAEINPLYLTISQQLVQARVDARVLQVREQGLLQQIRDVTAETIALNEAISRKEVAVARLTRQHQHEVLQPRHALETEEAYFKWAFGRMSEAQRKKGQVDVHVAMGVPAQPPTAPIANRWRRTSTLAAGAVLALSLAAVWASAYVPAGSFRL